MNYVSKMGPGSLHEISILKKALMFVNHAKEPNRFRKDNVRN